jgi:hypothetical protein
MAMLTITLNEDAFWQAAVIGMERQMHSVLDGRRMRIVTGNDDGWRNHIEGSCAEMAAAILTGLHWHGEVNAFGQPDLGQKVDVKLRRAADWQLTIKEHEPDEWFYILMHGTAPTFQLRGYIKGATAKALGKFTPGSNGNSGYYTVPHELLKEWGQDEQARNTR